MALKYWLMISQLAGYSIGLIFSLCIVIPMGLHEYDFNGHCMLFSKATLDEKNEKLIMIWSSRVYCNYVLVIGVYMTIYCCIQICRLLKFHFQGSDSTFLLTSFEAIVCMLLSVAVVPAAIIVTLGFVSWCDAITESFISCGDAAGLKVDSDDNIDTSSFFIHVNIVQLGTWAAFATYVDLAVLSSIKLYLNHQEQNIHSVTLYRERQRLLTQSGLLTSLPGQSTPPSSSLEQ